MKIEGSRKLTAAGSKVLENLQKKAWQMKHKVAIWIKDGEIQVVRSSTDLEVEIISMNTIDNYLEDRFDQLKDKLPFVIF
jgi:hypothetical protein